MESHGNLTNLQMSNLRNLSLIKSISIEENLSSPQNYHTLYMEYKKAFDMLSNKKLLIVKAYESLLITIPKYKLSKNHAVSDAFTTSGNLQSGLRFQPIPKKKYDSASLKNVILEKLPHMKHILMNSDKDDLVITFQFSDSEAESAFHMELSKELYNKHICEISNGRDKIMKDLKSTCGTLESFNKFRKRFDLHISELKTSMLNVLKVYLNT